MPVHVVNRSLNFDVKSQAMSAASSVIEMLAKAEKAENNIVPLIPSLTDRIIPKNTRRSLLSVVSWAKEIPMFTRLPVEDQIELITTTWSEVNTLKLVYHVATCPFRNDINFQTDELAHLYLTDSQEVASCVIKTVEECVASIKDIQLDEPELSCLKLITVMNPCKCDYIVNQICNSLISIPFSHTQLNCQWTKGYSTHTRCRLGVA